MKIKRSTTLAEALDEVAQTAQNIRSGATSEIDGHRFSPDQQVVLEIEFESKKGEEELEFEIKWPGTEKAGKSARPPRGRGHLLRGVVAGALLGGALLAVLRKRGRGDEAR